MAISRQDRARQFLPFDALKGLKEALREKEIEYVDRIELTGAKCEELEESLKIIEKGNKVRIKYYKNRQYVKIEGIVTNIDTIMKKIIIEEEKISFINIYSIDIL